MRSTGTALEIKSEVIHIELQIFDLFSFLGILTQHTALYYIYIYNNIQVDTIVLTVSHTI